MPDAVSTQIVACPDCAARVPSDQLDAHLRRVHRVFRFRGVRRPLPDTVAALVSLLDSPNDVAEAWRNLEAIADDEYADRADSFLAASASRVAARADDELHDAIASAVAAGPLAPRILIRLADEDGPAPRRFALGVAARVPPPLDSGVLSALRPLLADRRLPWDATLSAAAVMIRSTGKEGPAAAKLFKGFINGWGKSRGLERLAALEREIGSSATLAAVRAQIEERQRMSCPRCGIELRRPKMVDHLWEAHRLVMDGRRVREAWSAIEHWLEEITTAAEPFASELDARCRSLAHKADGDDGLRRVGRMLLSRGRGSDEERATILAEAAAVRASLCPHCFGRVPVPQTATPRPLSVWRGRLSGFGYRVEVGDRGLFTRLEIDTPSAAPRRGPEPGRLLTRNGAMLFLAGPPVLAAVVISLGVIVLPPLLPVTLLLLGAVAAAVLVHLGWRERRPALDRAVDMAWKEVTPRLHADGFSPDDSAFAAGLAWVSLGHGRSSARTGSLLRLMVLTERAAATGLGALDHLADLRRLAIDDASGRDPVPLVVAEIAPCFEGRRPLRYAQRLLSGWDSPLWTKSRLARLRVLLCDKAFEAGLEVAHLRMVGESAPALGSLLKFDDLDGLARLRLLWSMRARYPWEKCGPALTAFDVAERSDLATYFDEHSDLLLLQEPIGGKPPIEEGDERPILVTGEGVVFQGALFTEMPEEPDVIELSGVFRGGYDVVIDERRFWLLRNPVALTERLENWFHFFFSEFRPRVDEVQHWTSKEGEAVLRALEAVSCPECGRPVVPREGQVAAALALPQ